MAPTLILDTSVLISGLRSSLGASYVLLDLVGSDRFTTSMKSLPALKLTADDVKELLSVADPDDELVL